MSNKQTTTTKDAANKKIIVIREFDAPPDEVWKAWTDSNVLDAWWAPKPVAGKNKKYGLSRGRRLAL